MKNRREKKYIFQLMLRYKKELILNTVLSFFLLAIYMVTPILEQKIIDEGILSKDYVILLKLVFIAAFIGIRAESRPYFPDLEKRVTFVSCEKYRPKGYSEKRVIIVRAVQTKVTN